MEQGVALLIYLGVGASQCYTGRHQVIRKGTVSVVVNVIEWNWKQLAKW